MRYRDPRSNGFGSDPWKRAQRQRGAALRVLQLPLVVASVPNQPDLYYETIKNRLE
jgi:hypothetical protein